MRNNRYGFLTLIGLGAFYIYRNRQQIMSFLNERGIDLSNTENLTSTVRQGFDRVRETVQSTVGSMGSQESSQMSGNVSSTSQRKTG